MYATSSLLVVVSSWTFLEVEGQLGGRGGGLLRLRGVVIVLDHHGG